MNTASYTQREKDLACASCTLASQMKDCKWCMFFDAERDGARIPTILDIRTVSDVDSRQWRVADVMDFGASLPYSVVLYEIDDTSKCKPHPLAQLTDQRTMEYEYDAVPDETMPVIDMDKIEPIEY